jgi:hypothetical protein
MFGGDEIPGYKMSLRLGLISAFQSLLLIGLSNSQDYLANVFGHPILKKLGSYGFPQYLLQFMVYAYYKSATHTDTVDIRYFLLLFILSVIFYTSINKLIQHKQITKLYSLLIPFLIMYLMLQPFLSHFDLSTSSNGARDLPAWWTSAKVDFTVNTMGLETGTLLLHTHLISIYF